MKLSGLIFVISSLVIGTHASALPTLGDKWKTQVREFEDSSENKFLGVYTWETELTSHVNGLWTITHTLNFDDEPTPRKEVYHEYIADGQMGHAAEKVENKITCGHEPSFDSKEERLTVPAGSFETCHLKRKHTVDEVWLDLKGFVNIPVKRTGSYLSHRDMVEKFLVIELIELNLQ